MKPGAVVCGRFEEGLVVQGGQTTGETVVKLERRTGVSL